MKTRIIKVFFPVLGFVDIGSIDTNGTITLDYLRSDDDIGSDNILYNCSGKPVPKKCELFSPQFYQWNRDFSAFTDDYRNQGLTEAESETEQRLREMLSGAYHVPGRQIFFLNRA
ncbi:hypothetical protein [Stenoxybacter acetivorans]|uniref:hypothetical protein n=1 Tax=Stenoxybacter acetivorans TaxID=422441 RepID=UPI000560D2E8|nr:hypothetical protein [Stenoxybacter acetivorans]